MIQAAAGDGAAVTPEALAAGMGVGDDRLAEIMRDDAAPKRLGAIARARASIQSKKLLRSESAMSIP